MSDKILLATYREEEYCKDKVRARLSAMSTGERSKKVVSKALTEIDPEVLSKNLEPIIKVFSGMFKAGDENNDACHVDQIEIHLNVNAKGGIELIGSLQAGVEAGIKIILTRK